MIKFTKAHAYGNDFIYVRRDAVEGAALDALARELCDRHTGIGGDGLIVFEPTTDGASMRLFNADGGRAEVSGNGVRGLCALLFRNPTAATTHVMIHTDAGAKQVTRIGGVHDGTRQNFRTAMGLPRDLRRTEVVAGGEA